MVGIAYRVSGLAVVLSATIAGAAAAAGPPPQYGGQISGTLQDPSGVQSNFTVGPQFPGPDQVRIGRTATNFQVGANATAAHGGTSETEIQMAPFDRTVTSATSLEANSVVLYRINLDGSAGDAFVPVDVKAQLQVNWSQGGNARAIFELSDEFTVGGAPQILIDKDIDKFTTPGKDLEVGNDEFGVDQVFNLIPGHTYDVKVFSSVSASILGFDPNSNLFGEDSAIADPTFTVQGDFASRWNIAGVPVDASTGGAPEPAGWALMIVGFGLAGAGLRRRRACLA